MSDHTRLTTALESATGSSASSAPAAWPTVYLARDLKHDREVALKVLRPELGAVLGAERFLAEIKITARLDHPHILTLIDSGEAERPPLLRAAVRARRVAPRQAESRAPARPRGGARRSRGRWRARSTTRTASGVVHRDIKPENILLHEGEAMLADFGIALAVKEAGGNRLTETGLSLGTPQYMSPEQATGDRRLDARSDVYSLAAVLYEMLAGEPPVTGATRAGDDRQADDRAADAPARGAAARCPRRSTPRWRSALDKTPADRFASAGEFARALEAQAATERGTAPTVAVPGGRAPAARWMGRRRRRGARGAGAGARRVTRAPAAAPRRRRSPSATAPSSPPPARSSSPR